MRRHILDRLNASMIERKKNPGAQVKPQRERERESHLSLFCRAIASDLFPLRCLEGIPALLLCFGIS